MGLWQTIRGWFVRDDDPSLGQDVEPTVTSVQYPRPGVLEDGPAEESAAEEREGEGFR